MNCELYRHYSRNGELLYVGISASTAARLMQHRANSGWFDDLFKITIERFPDRRAAKKAEFDAIRLEAPKYNKQFVYQPPPAAPEAVSHKLETAFVRKHLGNDNQIASVCGVHRSSVGRWKATVPQKHVPALVYAISALRDALEVK